MACVGFVNSHHHDLFAALSVKVVLGSLLIVCLSFFTQLVGGVGTDKIIIVFIG